MKGQIERPLLDPEAGDKAEEPGADEKLLPAA